MSRQLAHDVNNLLLPILWLTKVSVEALPDGNDIRNDLQQVIAAAERCKSLVEQILTPGLQNTARLRPVRICGVVKEASNLLCSMVPKTITVNVHINLAGRLVLADPDQIHRVILNLGSNALNASDLGRGQINVSLDQVLIPEPRGVVEGQLAKSAYAKLSVSDDGAGMDDNELHRIFRRQPITEPDPRATGLGLSIIRSIVKAHNGAIAIDSTLGKGTTVAIYLPIHGVVEPDRRF